ncbi:uncharacterized protein LOC129738255 [Uranotaenia lowii]|uniref:uncharacterized protein LOC129738255 n=1 Tax=Uranotaenia lowii TaxID=190385 RepID=UPI0024799133|nr:uncharacterized protein LOC129738255 [Uranotaenia lowii]
MENDKLHELLRTQYILEESGINPFPDSAENLRAISILESTAEFLGDRYQVGLLWKKDSRAFPDSYPMAIRREAAFEKKLSKNPDMEKNVRRQIQEYKEKGYAHIATEEELKNSDPSQVWYLPLNVALNPRKPSKVRLVWDAAASVNGKSLNSELLAGPDLLASLPGIISRFREKPVAFGGDIAEMYHQLRIRPQDRQVQRFLFREDPSKPPQVFVMDVATFGATCSPCSAHFIKNLNARKFADKFPRASEAILEQHYVDDYYDSTDTVEEAINLTVQVKAIHEHGGFVIRNFVSNSREYLERIEYPSSISNIHIRADKLNETERVLGVVWDPDEDVFSFSTVSKPELNPTILEDKRPSKRLILSCVMSMFDPLGLISPLTIHGKLLVQNLWRTGCTWDDPIDDDSFQKWGRWKRLLSEVSALKIPRCYFGNALSTQCKDVELHIFSDASESAYGCAAFFRAKVNGEVRCSLLMSRSKVAPLKQLSIPRLELLGAVVGARVAETVQANHRFKIVKRYFWTDSLTVLSWIRSDQRKYNQFIGFRIGEILNTTKLVEWRWVPTRYNVTDLLTKWKPNFDYLNPNSSWFRGPSFLYLNEEAWPEQKFPQPNIQEEMRAQFLLHDVHVPASVIDVTRISKWSVLVRTMASVLRFISNCKRKCKKLCIETLPATETQLKLIIPNVVSSELTPLRKEELQQAETFLFKFSQGDMFPDDLRVLTKNSNLPPEKWSTLDKSSFLFKLTPMLDESGLIRVEGRTENADMLPFDLRFPIILPKGHPVTLKIIQSFHEKFGHAYRDTVKNELRQRFCIQHIGSEIKKVSANCNWCKVNRNRPVTPRMAPLPIQRVTPFLRPFSYVGVDYLGPITVTVGRRSEKRWICLFTCMVVRAIHLEVVHTLNTESCLMAIRRFIGRRGPPLEFLSDNGTNFKGASRELKNELHSINLDCANAITTAQTGWRFNPPATPHMGGAWERLVRSVKDALFVLDDGKKLTDEILVTSIVEAEDMINSRPLTVVSSDIAEELSLSPNHFLRGASPNESGTIPHFPSEAETLRNSFQRSQQLAYNMWKRWIREYVPTLNQRTKWFGESDPLKVGDLVYVVDGGNRKLWIRGIVDELIMAGDGRIRQAWVKTNSGRLKRGTAKLAVLEISGCKADQPEVASGVGLRVGDLLGTAEQLTPIE